MKKLFIIPVFLLLGVTSFYANANDDEVKEAVVLSNFDVESSIHLDLVEFANLFSNSGEGYFHHSCQGASGSSSCSATCTDSQSCTCRTGRTWYGTEYCVCECSGGVRSAKR